MTRGQITSRPGAGVSLAGGVALLVMMFATKWYGVAVAPRSALLAGTESAVGAWHELTVLRWLLLAAAIAALVGAAVELGPLVAGLGALAAGGLLYRVLLDPPAPRAVLDVKVGAFLGLLGAVTIALGGLESVGTTRQRLRRRRGGRDRGNGPARPAVGSRAADG